MVWRLIFLSQITYQLHISVEKVKLTVKKVLRDNIPLESLPVMTISSIHTTNRIITELEFL